MQSRIQLLSQQVANQIAAGEVIERPAAVVKELVENSIDAGATQITIELRQGGLSYIRVIDNGCGIDHDDLALSVKRHATSKISAVDDLMRVMSLGFRGEALSSIAAVSRFSILSRRADQAHGYRLSMADDLAIDTKKVDIMPAAHLPGTSVEVADLFYNVPARRKFLRQPKTELHHILTTIERIALSQPLIGFTVKHHQKTLLSFSPLSNEWENEQERLSAILGEEFLVHACDFSFVNNGLCLKGTLGLPTYSRTQPDKQYCYVNGRYVKDKLISHAVKMAYHDVLFHDRYPTYVLKLTLAPERVDVNVHPTKHEVRFREPNLIRDFIVHGIVDALAQTLVPTSAPAPIQDDKQEPSEISNSGTSVEKFSSNTAINEVVPAKPENIMPTLSPPSPSQPHFKVKTAVSDSVVQQRPLQQLNIAEDKAEYAFKEERSLAMPPLGYAIGQLHQIFILAQNQQGLVIVDMHAAHERVLYEQLKQQIAQQGLAVQTLLIPVTVNLTRAELSIWEMHQSTLAEAGIESALAGPETIALRTLPMLLKQYHIEELVRDWLADCAANSTATSPTEQKVYEILASITCHAAVRARDRLSIEQMNALLRQIEKTPHSGQCNHGRPTVMEYSLKTIDKWFLRGQ